MSRIDTPHMLELVVNDAVFRNELLLKYTDCFVVLWFLAQKFLRKS